MIGAESVCEHGDEVGVEAGCTRGGSIRGAVRQEVGERSCGCVRVGCV